MADSSDDWLTALLCGVVVVLILLTLCGCKVAVDHMVASRAPAITWLEKPAAGAKAAASGGQMVSASSPADAAAKCAAACKSWPGVPKCQGYSYDPKTQWCSMWGSTPAADVAAAAACESKCVGQLGASASGYCQSACSYNPTSW